VTLFPVTSIPITPATWGDMARGAPIASDPDPLQASVTGAEFSRLRRLPSLEAETWPTR